MSDEIRIYRAQGTWVVRVRGAVLGESRNALELHEAGRPPVIYFPRADIAMAFLDPSPTRTTCPRKGEARYFHIVAKSTTLRDAVWSYETPKEEVSLIAGHLAFVPEHATVERV